METDTKKYILITYFLQGSLYHGCPQFDLAYVHTESSFQVLCLCLALVVPPTLHIQGAATPHSLINRQAVHINHPRGHTHQLVPQGTLVLDIPASRLPTQQDLEVAPPILVQGVIQQLTQLTQLQLQQVSKKKFSILGCVHKLYIFDQKQQKGVDPRRVQ